MKRLVVCMAAFGVLAVDVLSQDTTYYPVEPIPMNIEVELPGERYYVGENFPVTVRITNPNPFDVFLAGFKFGALEPHMEISFPEGTVFPEEGKHWQGKDFIDISLGGTISARGWTPVLVAAGGWIEDRRLIYIDTMLDLGHWVLMPPGRYRVRIPDAPGAVTPGEPRGYPKTKWSFEVVEFVLTMPAGRDRTALEFLRRQTLELVEREVNPEPGFRRADFELRMYQAFLEQFPDTVYAPEIRWRTGKLLVDKLGNHEWADEHPEMVDLFDECLTFCLEKGGAYAEAFLKPPQRSRSVHNLLELAVTHERPELAVRIVEGVAQAYPEDEDGNLYRRFGLAGLYGSKEEALEIAEEMRRRFPKSDLTRRLDDDLRRLDRIRATQDGARRVP